MAESLTNNIGGVITKNIKIPLKFGDLDGGWSGWSGHFYLYPRLCAHDARAYIRNKGEMGGPGGPKRGMGGPLGGPFAFGPGGPGISGEINADNRSDTSPILASFGILEIIAGKYFAEKP